MKKILLLISFCFFQITNSQIINIPDANFKTFLTYTPTNGFAYAVDLAGAYTRVDSNFDNQISVQEASNISGLIIYDNTPVSDLTGLEFFVNLNSFTIYSSTLLSFNFPTLVNLEYLTINVFIYISVTPYYSSSLNVLNLDGNINLKTLYAVTGNATSLNLSNNINLENLYLWAVDVDSLDVSSNVNLTNFFLATGNLSSLIISSNNIDLVTAQITIQNSEFNIQGSSPYLKNLYCYFEANNNLNLSSLPGLFIISFAGQGLTTLDLSTNLMLAGMLIEDANITTINLNSNLNLEYIGVKNSNLQSINIDDLQYVKDIDFSNNDLTTLDLSNLFILNSFNVSNNLLTQLSIKNMSTEVGGFNISGNPTLQNICCDASQIITVQNQCNFFNYTNTIVSSNCTGLSLSTENEVFSENRISLFPNPTSDILNIESESVIDSISVSDINGRFVAANFFDTNKVDVQNLQSGIYFLQIVSNSKINTIKFIKE